MSREAISARQAFTMILVLTTAPIAQFLTSMKAANNAWVAVLLAMGAGVPMALLYARILSILPGRDFFDTTQTLMGKAASRIVWLLMALFCLSLGSILLANFGHFATVNNLQNTPVEFMVLIMAAVCVLAVKLGVEVLARCTYLFAFLVFLYTILVSILSTRYTDVSNLMPLFYDGIGPVLEGALGALCFPFAEIAVFLLVFPPFKKSVSCYRIFVIGMLLGGVTVLGVTTSILSIMGPITVEQPLYAAYKNLSFMKLGDFITRLEVFGIPVFGFFMFLNIVVPMLGACRGFSRTLGYEDYRFLAWPVGLLMAGIAMFAMGNVLTLHKWFYDEFPYYAVVFEIAIPLVLYIWVEIRYRILKGRGAVPV